MKNWKNLTAIVVALAGVFLLTAATITTTYYGKFVGDGSSLTNIPITGSSMTFAQINALAPGVVVTNGLTTGITLSNNLTIDAAHSLKADGNTYWQVISNTMTAWPAVPSAAGACAIVNSNGWPYMLLSTNGAGGGSTTWTGTNKLGW